MDRRDGLALLGAVVLIGVVVEALRSVPDTSPWLVAALLLLVVVGSATIARLRVAIVASVLAALGLDFFFVPPVDTFAIANPEDGMALAGFLAVAIIASRVSARARAQAVLRGRHSRLG